MAVSEVLPRLSSSYAYSRTPKEKAHLGSALHTTETSINLRAIKGHCHVRNAAQNVFADKRF